ncbi:MAG: aminopeptidase [Patescibacteria group bacterium]|nr:aminopeptidase [Patescibacteria group bacterium]
MVDIRVKKLAKILTDYSVKIKKDDKVLISANPEAWVLAKEVYKLCLTKGAFPYTIYSPGDLNYFFYKHASLNQLQKKPEIALFLTNWADKFVRLYSSTNNRTLSNIDPKRLMITAKVNQPVKKIMLKKPWVLTEFPSFSMAQSAGISLDELENIYFKACLQDWNKISKTLKKLKSKLDNAKKIEVIGEKTHLTLSFTNRLFQAADGKYNMPDGEVFGAPLDFQTKGQIYFDLPSLRSGNIVEGVSLTFKKGKVIKASAEKGNKYLQAALNTDSGSKRLGEFAIGTNYGIKKPMLNTLFDEKIGGTIHLALGSAYPDKEGGGINKSAIHWDLVKSMTGKKSKVLVNNKPILINAKLLV